MDNIKQVGKSLKTTRKEASLNTKRMAENFALPERKVNSFNKLHPYETTFSMAKGSVAKLNIKITPLTIPCTVNPPILGISCFATFRSDNPGYIDNPFTTTQSIVPGVNDFSFTTEGILVPVDGCYSVLWESPAWGAGYFADKTVTVGLLHNEFAFRLVEQTTTGVIITLGPGIYVYTPASPVYGVVECKAGDIISAFMTENDISQGYPWIGHDPALGTGLSGFFYTGIPSSLKIELVATAEG